MEVAAEAGRIEAGQHRLKVADHSLRPLIANAEQNRRCCRYWFAPADVGGQGHHRRDRIGRKTHNQEANHAVPEPGHHPGQRNREQHEQRDVSRAKAAWREGHRGKRKRAGHREHEQDGKKHTPAGDSLPCRVNLVGLKRQVL
jgi:hypothetical protein